MTFSDGYNRAVSSIRWLGLVIAALSSALLAATIWPVPRYVDPNIDYPKQIRLGNVDTITLSIQHEFSDEANIVAVAHAEAVGLQIVPSGDVVQSTKPGQSVMWRWRVAAGDEPGRHVLNIIVHLRQVQQGDGEITDQPIWARSLTVTVIDVFGMPASAARSIALVGTAAGFGLTLLPFTQPLLFRRKP